MQQWLRKARVTFPGGFIVNPDQASTNSDLRVVFDVEKGISGSANTADIRIWNLKEGNRNAVGKELDTVELAVGYAPPTGASNIGVIFRGQIRDVEHVRDGPDIITSISCGDGDRAFRRATISRTYPRGTPVQDVIEGIYEELERQGIDRGEWKFPEDIDAGTFKRPYSLCGSCVRELNVLGRGKNFYWSVQNGVLEIIPSDGFLPGAVLITPRSGMVGTPTITDNGVKVTTLLNPEIRPNRIVQVESETLEMNSESGRYRVSNAIYAGDNREGAFEVTVHGEAISAGKVDEGAPQ